jgi:peptidyl-prolyl cis-trans isomerase A (cyclophilin A)
MKALYILFIILIQSLYVSAQQVKISTDLGPITVQLEPEKAPITVANFMKYVEGGFYEGGSFFRTVRADNQPVNPVKITVIQGGANPLMQSVLFDPIPLERTSETGILHKNGTISMARSDPDSAQDSFFICIEDQPELDFGGKRNPDGQGFAAFGQVIGGMDVVQLINQAEAEGQSINPPILILNMVVME